MVGADRFLVDDGAFTMLELFKALIERVLMGVFACDDEARVVTPILVFVVGRAFDEGLRLAALALAGELIGTATGSLGEDFLPTTVRFTEAGEVISGPGMTEG